MNAAVEFAGAVALVVLAICLVRAERRARALSEQLAAAEREARTDPLTGLANRNGLLHAFATAQATAGSDDRTAVVLFDLDRLKPINDTHGHDAGDQVLCEVARRIALPTERISCAARIGGDEFVVLLAPAPAAVAVRQAEAHATALRTRIGRPIAVDSTRFTITSSAGVAVLAADRLEHLLTAADRAMYRAKHTRIGVSHYRPEVDGPPEASDAWCRPDAAVPRTSGSRTSSPTRLPAVTRPAPAQSVTTRTAAFRAAGPPEPSAARP